MLILFSDLKMECARLSASEENREERSSSLLRRQEEEMSSERAKAAERAARDQMRMAEMEAKNKVMGRLWFCYCPCCCCYCCCCCVRVILDLFQA